MKIVVFHQYYLAPGEPGGSRYNELARLWSEGGHDVTVVAGTLNYTTGEIPEAYRGRWIFETRDARVRVLRCYVPPTYRDSYLGRMWAFFGFTVSACTAAMRVADADVVIGTSPPLTIIIPAWLLSRRKAAPLVFEIRDLWPESAITTGVLREGSMLARALYGLERWGCRVADKVNVLTPAFRESLVQRGLAPEDKIVFVPNGADAERFTPGPRDNEVRRRHGWGDRFVVMYAGAHGRANAIGQLLDAAERLRDRPDILLVTVGDGAERARLDALARSRGLTNVMLCGPQPKDDMPDFVRACDVGAAVLQNNPTFRTVYPNKVFDYMACERPTLLAIDGVARKLVCDEARAGVFATPEDPDVLARVIRQLADDPAGAAEMGRRGRAWVLANATRQALAKRYLDILSALVSERRGGTVAPLRHSASVGESAEALS
ncbi:glycosyltransferase family 4 protein [Chondromyces crocatus]|uniref:Glycosyl transferase family 1 n=1 Tax=Chondromyces crocatus TaxID=52 RepID=A0A0K1EA94_CHOCO|nr:glycosyltransferase family 4 protein [Chondromyces crocatus]AKT37582.1 glycosyl transferase family 1 [Chondromyces crocatus]